MNGCFRRAPKLANSPKREFATWKRSSRGARRRAASVTVEVSEATKYALSHGEGNGGQAGSIEPGALVSVRGCKWLCAALVGLAPAPAFALAPANNRLVYSREGNATRCPDEAALRTAVHARLGYDAFSPWGERAVVAEIFEDAGKLRARLRLLDEHGVVVGTREVRAASDDCEELVRSLALSISITLDPLAPAPRTGATEPEQTQALEPEPAREPVGLPNESPEGAPPVVAVAPRAEPPRDGLASASRPVQNPNKTWPSLRLGPVLHAGLGPGTGQLGARVGLAIDRGVGRLVIDATATLPTSIDSSLGGSANVQVTMGSLAPCISQGFLAGCGLVVAGRTSSWATGTTNTRADSAPYFALGARFEARVELDRSFQLVFGVDGVRNLTPVSVQLHDQKLWQGPDWAGALAIAAGYTFR